MCDGIIFRSQVTYLDGFYYYYMIFSLAICYSAIIRICVRVIAREIFSYLFKKHWFMWFTFAVPFLYMYCYFLASSAFVQSWLPFPYTEVKSIEMISTYNMGISWSTLGRDVIIIRSDWFIQFCFLCFQQYQTTPHCWGDMDSVEQSRHC
jgi:hypothetical protein